MSPKIIFLTGIIGAGKTTLAKSYIPRVYYVAGDHIQGMVAKRAFPFIRESHIWNWNILDSHLDDFMHTGALFNVTVRSSCHKLDGWSGDLIIEACNLWKAWFREKVYGTIRDITRVYDYQEFYLNYLPDAELVASRVKQRNRHGEGKWHSVEEIKQELDRCLQRTMDRSWELFRTEELIRGRIDQILALEN